MLSPHEFSLGSIGDAVGLTLVLHANRGTTFLVNATVEPKVAVVLEGDHALHSFECTGNGSWQSVLIPNVSIEVDETSVVDNTPLGALVRSGTMLAIKTKWDGRTGNGRVPLVNDLTKCPDHHSASFTRWRIVIGDGVSKRELKTFEFNGES
jgi:hypothetical protein